MPGLDASLTVHLHKDAVTLFAIGTVTCGGTWRVGDVMSIVKCHATMRLDVAALYTLCSSVVRDLTWHLCIVSSAACAAMSLVLGFDP